MSIKRVSSREREREQMYCVNLKKVTSIVDKNVRLVLSLFLRKGTDVPKV